MEFLKILSSFKRSHWPYLFFMTPYGMPVDTHHYKYGLTSRSDLGTTPVNVYDKRLK